MGHLGAQRHRLRDADRQASISRTDRSGIRRELRRRRRHHAVYAANGAAGLCRPALQSCTVPQSCGTPTGRRRLPLRHRTGARVTAPRRPSRFATTRWTIVNAAARPADERASAALTQLCEIYWPPLYGYLRGRGYSAEQAQDLTQGFFLRVLETQAIRAADPARGRF